MSRNWLQTELIYTANAYQAFQQEVWMTIITRTQEADEVARLHETQISRLRDVLALIQKAPVAWNNSLDEFRRQVQEWGSGINQATAFLSADIPTTQRQVYRLVAVVQPSDPADVPLPPTPPVSQTTGPIPGDNWRRLH